MELPTTMQGRPFGPEQLSFELCHQIRSVLTGEVSYDYLSRRAADELAEARIEFGWLKADSICVRWPPGEGRTEIWTYAGQKVNSMLQSALRHLGGRMVTADNFRLRLNGVVAQDNINRWWRDVRQIEPTMPEESKSDRRLEQLKFAGCLPLRLAASVVAHRCQDLSGLRCMLDEPFARI